VVRRHGCVATIERVPDASYVSLDSEGKRRTHGVDEAVADLAARGRWMAATLIAADAVLSHRSAAALWGIRRADRVDIEITVPRSFRPRWRLEIHLARLPDDEITRHDRIPVTTPPHAPGPRRDRPVPPPRAGGDGGGDPAPRQPDLPRRPRRAVPGPRGDARHQAAARRPRHRPQHHQARARAPVFAFLDAHRLPRPHVNGRVDGKEVDCLWPEQRLIAELDGFATHGTRTAFETDRARDRAVLLAGYRVTRITWRQVARQPKALAAELDGLLSPRGTRRQSGEQPCSRRSHRARCDYP
jgi:very-short-patch-repair endonuclease